MRSAKRARATSLIQSLLPATNQNFFSSDKKNPQTTKWNRQRYHGRKSPRPRCCARVLSPSRKFLAQTCSPNTLLFCCLRAADGRGTESQLSAGEAEAQDSDSGEPRVCFCFISAAPERICPCHCMWYLALALPLPCVMHQTDPHPVTAVHATAGSLLTQTPNDPSRRRGACADGHR